MYTHVYTYVYVLYMHIYICIERDNSDIYIHMSRTHVEAHAYLARTTSQIIQQHHCQHLVQMMLEAIVAGAVVVASNQRQHCHHDLNFNFCYDAIHAATAQACIIATATMATTTAATAAATTAGTIEVRVTEAVATP